MDTVEGLGDAARLARGCAVIGHAVTLARWIGTGRRPVTPGRVLRKADVPAAGAALGVEVPARLRTMADIRELHRPWYWSEEEPEEPSPFGLSEVNRRLAALGRDPA